MDALLQNFYEKPVGFSNFRIWNEQSGLVNTRICSAELSDDHNKTLKFKEKQFIVLKIPLLLMCT